MDSETPSDQRSVNRLRSALRPGWIALFLLLVLLIAAVVATFIQLPDEAIVPGSAVTVAPLITVPSSLRQHAAGSVSLVDVDLVQLRAINYLFYRWNHNDQIVPKSEISGTESQSQYDEQGVLEMATAQQAATVVGLQHLGYKVTANPSGVAIYQLQPGSPSSLAVGEIIRTVDGHRIATIAQLLRRTSALRPGQHITLTTQVVGGHRVSRAFVMLGRVVDAGRSNEQCSRMKLSAAHSGGAASCIGIYVEQLYTTAHEPFPVGMSAEGIIGPSAGLAFTLGLIQALDARSLTGGAKIAATGTMSIDGAVGDVGGVAQKTIAVRNSGATVFFVPKVEYAVAKAAAGSHLTIVPVTNINQVLSYLEHHGGSLVTKSAK